LMHMRLEILEQNNLKLKDIQDVIRTLEPLEGARAFLDELRRACQVIILSDTFYEFAHPFMRKLGWPTLFCHSLDVEPGGRIAGYRLRQPDPKRKAVQALRGLNLQVVAAGDSYNDTTMLVEAHAGILFRAPENVTRDFPSFPHVQTYEALQAQIASAFASL